MSKRIIPCLDTREGRVVKGVAFVNIKDAGDPTELARRYEAQGADELVLLDISATAEGRATRLDAVRRVAAAIAIPLAVGGGIASLDYAKQVLAAGASKVGVNTAAVRRPELVRELAEALGSARVVAAIDAVASARRPGSWDVCVAGGQEVTEVDLIDWARRVEALGAGEILLTSVNRDGSIAGYDMGQLRAVADAVGIPVVASGGAGQHEEFYLALTEGGADAALAASVFHFGTFTVGQVKVYLAERGVDVRL